LHPLRQIVPASAIILSILFERAVAACPFCGGSGDKGDGLLQTLVVVAVVGFSARAVWRALSRERGGHHQDPPAESSPPS
jgi:hypothetical protein